MIRLGGVERGGGGECREEVKTMGSTHSRNLKRKYLSGGEEVGIPWGAVKGVEIRRKTSGEGGWLDSK